MNMYEKHIKRYKNTQRSKKKTAKIGVKSIHDIINKSYDLSFRNKIDYIRHAYSYYDGYTNLFHNADGRPTSLRYYLNDLIVKILQKEVEAGSLNKFNKKVVAWESLAKQLYAKYGKDYDAVHTTWLQESFKERNLNKSLEDIFAFISSMENNLSAEECRKLSIAKIEHLTSVWKNSSTPYDFCAKDALRIYIAAKKDQNRAERLMREYNNDKIKGTFNENK